jgi:hypothetical protein
MGVLSLPIAYWLLQIGITGPKVGEGTGVVRPVGQSLGNRVEKTIGMQGGTITSKDGKLQVDIPAGALNTTVTISIEPITRTLVDSNEAISDTAYRLTPHGQQFLKPVKLTFKLDTETFSKLTPAAAGIAYQDSEGRWKGLGKVAVNTTEKSLSVNTTHFSDWTIYESIYITPKEDLSVEVNGTVHLWVKTVTSLALLESDRQKEEWFLEEPYDLTPVSWRIVNGPGNGTILKVPTLPAATFTAPGSVPPNNPALVEAKVEVKNMGYLLLLKNITIRDTIQPGVHLRINGGAWVHFSTESFENKESYYATNGDYPYDKHSLYIRIDGGHAKGVGEWAWLDESGSDHNTTFEYIVRNPGPYTSYEHKYRNNDFDDWHMSPGYIRTTEYKEDLSGQIWATGEFLIERSTPFIDNHNGTPLSAKIEGNFRLRVD